MSARAIDLFDVLRALELPRHSGAARGQRTCPPARRPRALTELRQAGDHVCRPDARAIRLLDVPVRSCTARPDARGLNCPSGHIKKVSLTKLSLILLLLAYWRLH